MPSKDISRFMFQPRKHYSGVRMQQGRVILDSDWNESERIDDEDARRVRLEIIGPRGTPNGGFRVANVRPATIPIPGTAAFATYEFDVGAGSYYLGGLRVESDPEPGPETFLTQPDWLRLDASADRLPTLPTAERHDLVYLHTWEQPVSAVEDSELRERALGGPDTSVRVRRMRRVEVLPDAGRTCAAAFDRLVESITRPLAPDAGGPHTFDRATSELRSKAFLTAGPADDGASDDPCRPAVRGGFLGAENETLRIELVETNRFVWGKDNAAPLYRVTVEEIETPTGALAIRVRFLTRPRDQAAQPLAGQTVQLHPWGAFLPNGEKVADLAGHLSRVATSYTRDEQGDFIDLETEVPAAMREWLTLHDEHESPRDLRPPDPHPRYFYLRLWTGPAQDPADPAAITTPFQPGQTIVLGQTGLQVQFSDLGLPAEHWIVAARPHTPEDVVPWELLDRAPPAGPRRFFAPLAVIHWIAGPNGVVTPEVHDCRDRFPPLTRIKGCCTITVGDGRTSFGDVDSIQDALELLPDEGGKICLLPGRHPGRATLVNKTGVVIEGCGRRSVVVNPPDEPGYSGNGIVPPPPPGLISVVGGRDITLRRFAIEAVGLHAIEAPIRAGDKDPRASEPVRELVLEDLDVWVLGRSGEREIIPLAAIQVEEAYRARIEDCRVLVEERRDPFAAVFVRGVELEVVGNRIAVAPDEPRKEPELRLRQAWGGLQIGAPSRDVEVRDNEILFGLGHGITLGSVTYVEDADDVVGLFAGNVDAALLALARGRRFPVGMILVLTVDLCEEVVVDPPPIDDPDGGTLVPVSDGSVHDVRIVGNRIVGHGASGIATVAMSLTGSVQNPRGDFVHVGDLLVAENDLAFNMVALRRGRPRGPFDLAGGIALSAATQPIIRDNRIVANGLRHEGPVYGIGVVVLSRGTIVGNRISENGPTGHSGAGIAVGLVPSPRRLDKLPPIELALRVHGNYVAQPDGRALLVTGTGRVDVEGNYFESEGATVLAKDRGANSNPRGTAIHLGRATRGTGAACVQIDVLSLSRDLRWLARLPLPDGGIRFHDNETMLRWTNPGGYFASVALRDWFDDVSVKNNRFILDAGGLVTGRLDQFIGAIENQDPAIADRSYALFHVVTGGFTVHASMNRVNEGAFDAAASLLAVALFATSEAPVFACSAVYNHTTHCVYTVPAAADRTGNQTFFPLNQCQRYKIESLPGIGWRLNV